MDDFVTVNSSSGDLTLVTPAIDAFNSTLSVSLACFTEAFRGDREWSNFEQCVEYSLSLFTLQNLRFHMYPLRVVFPWESTADAVMSTNATATPNALAPHTNTDHVHGNDDAYYYYASGLELIYVFFLFSLVVVLCGASLADTYTNDEAYGRRDGRGGGRGGGRKYVGLRPPLVEEEAL